MMRQRYKYLIILLLVAASLMAFGRVAGNGFIALDDPEHITENRHIQTGFSGENIAWAFTAVVNGHWHPMTMLSHALDWSLFGANPAGHHVVNLILHMGAVIFLFLFLNKTTGNVWSAAFAAAFFALHPLRVESVAWATLRKDTLSLFLGMACIYSYACYAKELKISGYLLCLILFALALMSKPMLVTLPFVLLLLDIWPLKRCRSALFVEGQSRFDANWNLLREKIPFIFLAVISCVITVWAQNIARLIVPLNNISFFERVQNAAIAYISYLGKIFWPVDLAVMYPYKFSFPLWQVWGAFFIVIGITIIVVCKIRKLPFLFVGWIWYLGTLVPVIGLVQVGGQAIADRYTYLPSIGIALMLAWGMPHLFSSQDIRKKILFPAGLAVLVLASVLTWQQCAYWKNGITLFSHTLQTTNNNYFAYYFRGLDYDKLNQHQLAINDFNQAIHLNPNYSFVFYNRGMTYSKLGSYQRAIEDFNEAIRLNPDYAEFYNIRGYTYSKLGRYQDTLADYSEVIRRKPHDANAYLNRGLAYLDYGKNEPGCLDLKKACDLGICDYLEIAQNERHCR